MKELLGGFRERVGLTNIFLEEPISLVLLYDYPFLFVFFFSHLAKKYYFLTNEWTVFDHVTPLGQSSETISTLGSVSH